MEPGGHFQGEEEGREEKEEGREEEEEEGGGGGKGTGGGGGKGRATKTTCQSRINKHHEGCPGKTASSVI